MKELPRKAIASLGHRVGAAGRRGHSYVMLPMDIAVALKEYLSAKSKEEYQKEYRKL